MSELTPETRPVYLWSIRINGYGTFQFTGTEEAAEEVRASKARHEQGVGTKWRTDMSRESDRLALKIAELWDAKKGVPHDLIRKRRNAIAKENADV